MGRRRKGENGVPGSEDKIVSGSRQQQLPEKKMVTGDNLWINSAAAIAGVIVSLLSVSLLPTIC